MAAVGKAVQLWNQWELHVLVLLSFMLQVFLFFTGSLRRRSKSVFLRLCIWAAYLGADAVPIYTLGFLSRQDAPTEGGASGGIPPLAIIWVPFLLVHLGGPDNITAFAIADNNLWVRHFLGLGLQVILALYVVIWKSAEWRDKGLRVPCIFLFVAGIIKYGERTMALKNGNLKSPKGITDMDEANDSDDKDSRVVFNALKSMSGVHHLFAGHTIHREINKIELFQLSNEVDSQDQSMMKTLEIELGMVYDDLYTKATVLRTKTGLVFRSTTVVSTIVSLVIFLARNKQSYGKAEVVITYMLFIGGICMEIWALFMILLLPWTWYWLKIHCRRFGWFASVSMHLMSCRLGLSKKRMLWSNSMGQCDLASALGYDNNRPSSWKLGVIRMIRGMVRLVGVGMGAIFWFSKLIGIRHIEVDKGIIRLLLDEVKHVCAPEDEQSCFPNLRPLLKEARRAILADFGTTIFVLHVLTELHLRKYPPPSAPSGMDGDREKVRRLAEVCRKLSRYMLYIKMTFEEIFPSVTANERTLDVFMDQAYEDGEGTDIMENILKAFVIPELEVCVETLEELQRMWIRIIMYAAGKSRPEMHAAQLARGGELLTFVWLLMLHHDLGDFHQHRLELFPPDIGAYEDTEPRYAFNLPVSPGSSVSASSVVSRV